MATDPPHPKDVRLLKDKTHELAGRQRAEKEQRQRFESAARAANEKVVALSEHIEKLMVHLKHEAAAKAKVNELQRRTEREVALLKQRNAALGRRSGGREKAAEELREGTKILEDQLRLMDAKCVELFACMLLARCARS